MRAPTSTFPHASAHPPAAVVDRGIGRIPLSSRRRGARDRVGDLPMAAAAPSRRRGGRADAPGPRATRRGRSSRSPASRCVVLGGQARRETPRWSLLRARTSHQRLRRSRDPVCPKSAVRAVPSRLLLLCLLFRSSWLAAEGGRQVGAARVLHRRGGGSALAVSVGVAVGVPEEQRPRARSTCSRLLR